MFKQAKLDKLAATHVRSGEVPLAGWRGLRDFSVGRFIIASAGMGFGALGAVLTMRWQPKRYYVFITDRRVIIERLRWGLITLRRTDEVEQWDRSQITALELKDYQPKWTGYKRLAFDALDGPHEILVEGAGKDTLDFQTNASPERTQP